MKRISTRFLRFVPVWLLTRKAGFTALALAAPLMAMTAAFALAGTVPSSNSEGSTTTTATIVETVSTQASGHEEASKETDSRDSSATQPTTQTTPGPTVTPGPAQEGTAEAQEAHANGDGCDDVLFAATATPGPGGPVGCTVGNSGSHRQNGLEHGNKSATATGIASASPSASSSPDATRQDPHANGKGCDDVLFAAGRTPVPGGPVGCTVGNSGGHRQNGLHGNVATTASPSAPAAGSTSTTPVMDSTTGRGHAPANGRSKH